MSLHGVIGPQYVKYLMHVYSAYQASLYTQINKSDVFHSAYNIVRYT